MWRGWRACPLPKPGKPPQSLSGWRSILLHEASMKGVCAAYGPRCLSALRPAAPQDNAVVVRGTLCRFPWPWPKVLHVWLGMRDSIVHCCSLTVGLLSMRRSRQTLAGQESGQTAKFLHSLAEDLFDHPDEHLPSLPGRLDPVYCSTMMCPLSCDVSFVPC